MSKLKTPFQGELMTCCMCGKSQQSDRRTSSNWTTIDLEGQRWYVCPDELPLTERATVWDFRRAYEKIFRKIAEISEKKP
jgi:hypothetical protein